MIEGFLRDFLADALDAPVYIDVPKDHPNEYYVIEKTGSSRTNHIWQSVFAVQSYGNSFYNAASMIQRVNDLMLDELIKEDRVSDVSLNGSSNFTDTTKKQPRYQSVFVVTHY